ncbi:MAG: nucleotidyltransferase family protein [Candidatus Didemnitutus sp.]|nr:nucleotidyltransferase family protein [Candidatus Didemnitutus sp.]
MDSSKNHGADTAIVLTGGRGTRLGAATERVPKPLLPVAGRPFLFHVLDHLVAQGVRRVVFATGYLSEQFPPLFGTQYRGMAIVHSPETEPLGTGGAVRQAFARIDARAAFVLNGDTYFPTDLAALDALGGPGIALALTLRPVPDTARYGCVTLDGDRVTALVEKGRTGPGLINGGVYRLDRAAFDADAPSGPFSLERELFPRWVAERRVRGLASDAYFIDIGVPEDLARAQTDLAHR